MDASAVQEERAFGFHERASIFHHAEAGVQSADVCVLCSAALFRITECVRQVVEFQRTKFLSSIRHKSSVMLFGA
jgi:hypothetical protein